LIHCRISMNINSVAMDCSPCPPAFPFWKLDAVSEMMRSGWPRVLKPCGLLLAYDNDWGTFSVSSRDEESTKIIETLWEDSFTNRWIGRYLKRHFLEAGLQNVAVEIKVHNKNYVCSAQPDPCLYLLAGLIILNRHHRIHLC
jgi:hypothetical protein